MRKRAHCKSPATVLCLIAMLIGADAQQLVPRAGKTGPPMLLGTSVAGAADNLVVKSLGFSHLQTDSDHLIVNEPQPGHWDWTSADAGLAATRAAGLKWQYFPHYHWPPPWYRDSNRFVGLVGLRSHRKLAAMSIWSPDVTPWFEHCYAALSNHFNHGEIFALYLGIQGDFGETIFPMGWHPDEAKDFGANGVGLPDFWCGDASAREDFREWSRRKYHRLKKLNAAWGTRFADFSKVDYPPDAYNNGQDFIATASGRRYWLDFIQWYYDSMTHYTGEVCRIARKYFPNTLLQIPVGGGSENVMYAQDTSALPRIAWRHGVHTRSTHGGYAPFASGYAAMIKRIATSCKIYGAPHWLEPPNAITPDGEVARIMEALSCGNYGFWDWGANPIAGQKVFREYTNFFTRETPVVDVALFFPTTDHRLHPDIDFPRQLHSVGAKLRDVMDFDMVDEKLIADDALKKYRVLLWIEGHFIEKSALQRIAAWVKDGGVLVCREGVPPESVEGATSLGRSLLGLTNDSSTRKSGNLDILNPTFLRRLGRLRRSQGVPMSGINPSAVVLATVDGAPAIWATPHGKGWVIVNGGDAASFNELARDAAYNLSNLDSSKRDAAEVDGDWDGVYATLLSDGEVIYYNANATAAQKSIGNRIVELPPHSLRSAAGIGPRQ